MKTAIDGIRQGERSNSDAVACAPASRLPALELSEQALSLLKWLALVLMVVDHTNKYVFDESQGWMYALGRVAMPLFAFVLGYNLGRPGLLASGAHRRLAQRLLIFGVLATPAFMHVNVLLAGWYPVNMMFGLLAAVVAVWLFERGGRWDVIGACLVIAWGGALVEFWWPAVGLCLAVWAYRRSPSWTSIAGAVACLLALYLVNNNFWALAAVPVIALARFWPVELPRARWFFYAFYPIHLWLFWAYLAWVK